MPPIEASNETDAEATVVEAEETNPVESDEAPEAENDEPDWRKGFDADKAAQRINKLSSEARNLRERTKAAEKKAGDVDTLTKANDDLSRENLRLQVGYELGLPLALAKRLSGSTRDELIADAEELVQIAGGRVAPQRKPVEALRTGGEGDKVPEETDLAKIGAQIFRR